ncbi:hypothetical protein F8B43_4204 [Methylorubrum populi]|uniref:Uncharacterized protein n=1 Tax=Methylorubrum populi TaxID=223967 RepID=A0A833MZT3_9HYPH|nr:hypothetical protein F8B43_4204 [Methylorubrum populi]
MAGTAALKEKLSNSGDLGSLYNQAYAVYGGAQDRFRQESPGRSAPARHWRRICPARLRRRRPAALVWAWLGMPCSMR